MIAMQDCVRCQVVDLSVPGGWIPRAHFICPLAIEWIFFISARGIRAQRKVVYSSVRRLIARWPWPGNSALVCRCPLL